MVYSQLQKLIIKINIFAGFVSNILTTFWYSNLMVIVQVLVFTVTGNDLSTSEQCFYFWYPKHHGVRFVSNQS